MDAPMREVVADRLKKLQQLDLTAVKSLPAQTKEILSSLGNVTLAQYHDVTTRGEHRVVVQAVRPRWFGLFTAIEVDGFVVVPDGTRRPLAEQERWPFT